MRGLAGSLAGLAFAAGLVACGQASGEAHDHDYDHDHDHSGENVDFAATAAACASGEPPPPMGLMTSLPLVWPLDASFEEIANGTAERPWQAVVMNRCFSVQPLDTLSPIAGLSPDDPETDPLAGLERLAVIQPRGLSPADNVALDEWVRAGGQLLLVLDPMLTGHYELPLGDPRRPTDSALVPPVAERWGMEISFDETQSIDPREAELNDITISVAMTGEISTTGEYCVVDLPSPIYVCDVDKGRVTLIADAAMFEHPEFAGENGADLQSLIDFSFRQ